MGMVAVTVLVNVLITDKWVPRLFAKVKSPTTKVFVAALSASVRADRPSAMVVVTTPVPNTDVFTEVSRLLAVAHLLGEAQARLGVTPEIVEMFDILATKTSWFLHAMSDGTLLIKKTPAKPANSFKN